eukprot:scaffold72160_cov18-Tisochrysis_lutea.AAC.1
MATYGNQSNTSSIRAPFVVQKLMPALLNKHMLQALIVMSMDSTATAGVHVITHKGFSFRHVALLHASLSKVHLLGEPGRGPALEAGVVSRIKMVSRRPEMKE